MSLVFIQASQLKDMNLPTLTSILGFALMVAVLGP